MLTTIASPDTLLDVGIAGVGMRCGNPQSIGGAALQGWEQYFFVGKGTMHAMCCQAPAVYELLPDPLRNNIWPPERGPPKCTVFHQTGTPPSCAGVLQSDEPVKIEWPQGSGMQAEGQSPDGTGVKEQEYGISEFRDILGQALKGYTVTTYDQNEVTFPYL